jgi:hypothetical protein
VLFLAEFNHLNIWATDTSSTYLEAYTSEKVYIGTGPEFKERDDISSSSAGHCMDYKVVVLYGMTDFQTDSEN